VAWAVGEDPKRWRAWIPWAGLFGLAALPEALRLSAVSAVPAHHGFPYQMEAGKMWKMAAPLSVVVPGGAAGAVCLRGMTERRGRSFLMLAALTALTPAAVLLLQSLRTNVDLTMTRYLVLVWAGWFLGLGYVCGAWLERRWRLAFVTVYAVVTLAGSLYKTGWRIPHADADWRGAVRAAREWDAGRGRPLALQTGFVEGQFAEWLDDPRRVEFLRAPLHAYPYPGPSHVLPYGFRADRLLRIERPYVMVVYEDSEAPSQYVAAMAPDARPLGRFLRLRVYAVEADAR
jgi:hypothetical protein